MRMILCRPIARWRVLVVKYLACVIYTFALIFFIGLTALLAGLLRQGIGGLFVFAPVEGVFALFDFGEGVKRYLGALPLLSLSLLSISSLGFMLSCFNMKPAAATIVTLSIFFVDVIFRNIPYFESLKQWFFTGHMATWLNVFQPHIPAAQMIEDYAYLLAADLTLVVIGLVNFQQRDLKP
jgi:ABC-2 type transport system permease protein